MQDADMVSQAEKIIRKHQSRKSKKSRGRWIFGFICGILFTLFIAAIVIMAVAN